MKNPSGYGTNTTTPAGRANGQFNNNPGGGTGSGVTAEADNDNIYAVIAPIESWKEGGVSNSDETTTNSDMRDAIEEMVSKKVSGVADWVIGTNYSAPGTSTDLVMWKGFQFINISNVGNLGNDPLLFPKLWFKIPKVDTLMDQFYNGDPVSGGLSAISDRAGAQYLQNMLFGNYRLGGNGDDFSDFFRVALDGTIVTGDTTLEDDIFKVGTVDEYFNIDIIAPDVVGTRTLLDMGEYISTPQSVSGENDTMGDLQDDRAQGWQAGMSQSDDAVAGPYYGESSIDGQINETAAAANHVRSIYNKTNQGIVNMITGQDDGTNGAYRSGLTNRPKELTVGASYIIVRVAA